MNIFRRKSSGTLKVAPLLQQLSVSEIKPLDYILNNIDSVKFCYYQHKKPSLGCESAANLVLFFPDSSPVNIPASMIKCYINAGSPEEVERCPVLQLETDCPGQYTVYMMPKRRGMMEMHIKILDIIRHSIKYPVSVPATTRSNPINTFSSRLKYPYAVQPMRDGSMLISEYFSHRITQLDSRGHHMKSIGSAGNNKGQFNHPSGLALTSRGTLLVADRDNHRIQEMKLSGECVSSVGRQGTGRLQFNKPEGIAVCPSTGMVYVADCYNHRLQVLHHDLSFSHFIGGLGTDHGEFKHPFDLAFDSKGFLYVTDRCNDRVQKLTPDGSKCTVLVNGLDNPTGITVDDQDVLFICEYGLDLLVAVSSDGEFVPCELQGRCKGPYGIRFNPFTGDIIVCDTRNNRLLVF